VLVPGFSTTYINFGGGGAAATLRSSRRRDKTGIPRTRTKQRETHLGQSEKRKLFPQSVSLPPRAGARA
jgi:hypothetical protein